MICFSLVAHENEQGVMNQIDNLRQTIKKPFMVVLYNGGTNADFGRKTAQAYPEVKLCPYSRPLQYRKTGRVLYDAARWLRDEGIKYDYLVYLESDTMFIQEGFDNYLSKNMKGYDCIAQHWKKYDPKKDSPRSPGTLSMFRDWKRWKKCFQTDYFYKTSNPFQTYRYDAVQKILTRIDAERLEQCLAESPAESLGEMIFPTFAAATGAKAKLYPKSFKRYNRWKPELGIIEVIQAKQDGSFLFVHPVKSSRLRSWVTQHV